MIEKKISMIIPDFQENIHDNIADILNKETKKSFCELIVVTEKATDFDKDMVKGIPVSVIENEKGILHSLNQASKMAQGELVYVQSAFDSLDIDAVKAAGEMLSDNYNKINIAFFPQNEADTSDMQEGLYHVMLEQTFMPGVFNFLIKKEYCKFDTTLVARCAYLKLFMDAVSEEGYFGYTKTGCQKHTKGVFDPYRYEEVNSYEAYTKYYDFLLEYMSKKQMETNHAPWLFQVALIKSLDEILMKNALIPEAYTGEQKAVLRGKIQQIMDLAEVKALLRSKKIGPYHIAYLFTFRSNKMTVRSDAGRFALYDGEDKLFSWEKSSFYVKKLRGAKSEYEIRGVFQNPISSFINIDYFLVENGNSIKLQTTESKLSYRKTPQKISDCREYVLKLPYSKSGEYYFEAEILNNKFPVSIIYDKMKAENHEEEKVIQTTGMEVTITCNSTIETRKLSFVERIRRKFLR